MPPYPMVEGVRPGAFFDVFFFSIQTFSTIGYGGMSPVGLYGHVIVTIEAMVSLLFTAMATGLLFAKFATPTSRVRFSRTAVIGMHNGKRTLIFRMANERSNQIVEASMNVVVIRTEQTQEVEQLRRFYDLKLRRHRSPIFSLGWTAYHTIDSDSPLADATPESLAADESTVLVSLSGTDSTLWQTVYARHAYSWNEIEFDRRFVDLVQVRQDGSRMIDYAEFHSTVPADDSGAVTSLVG
ncbi:MAG: ion channel [Myxococcota bacterium]